MLPDDGYEMFVDGAFSPFFFEMMKAFFNAFPTLI